MESEKIGIDTSRSYLQSRNRDTDIENRCMDTKGGREGDELGDWD